MKINFKDLIEINIDDKYSFIVVMLAIVAALSYKIKLDHDEIIYLADLNKDIIER